MSGLVASLAEFFWSQVAPLSIQAAILLLAAGLLDRLLPRAVWPELRLAVGSILLLKLVLPPAWASPIPFLPAAALPAWAPLGFTETESWRGAAIAVAVAWLAGVAACFVFGAWQRHRLSLVWRAAEPAGAELEQLLAQAAGRLGLRRTPPLRIAAGLASPCVFGLWRPRILLPPDLAPQVAEHALLHELAHVRRGDLLLAAFLGLLRAAYFFHPLVHLAARRLEGLRELCCDRLVARRLGAETAAYRRTLLSFAARRHGAALAALPFAGRSSLLERLRALERAEKDRPLLRRGLTTLGAALALACAVPAAPHAEEKAAQVAELIARPPGCLQLRYLVMERMAAELKLLDQKAEEKSEHKEPK
jgi:beta-lactamase regulating signal transducer with metallopeptidase domain